VTSPTEIPEPAPDQSNSGQGDQSDQSDQGDDSEGKGSNGKVDPSLRLINTTPVLLDQSIDEPVTSGGDVVIGETPGGGI
jgi:hypothetical protein